MRTYEKVFSPMEALDIVVNKNDNYRKLKRQKASEYARVMKAGKWCEDNGETIKFYENGRLADGQHRLYAVYESDTPIKFLVVEEVSGDATETIDIGLKRSPEDNIRYRLRDSGKALESGAYNITKQVMNLRKKVMAYGQTPYKVGMTEIETKEECLSDIDGYNEAALFGKKIRNESAKVIKQGEVGSIFYYLTHDKGINEYFVKDYFNKLCSAARNDKTVYNTTISNLSSVKLSSADRIKELIWGWNSYIRGCTKKRRQFSGWFEYPTDKYYYTKNEIETLPGCINSTYTEEEASSPVRIIS